MLAAVLVTLLSLLLRHLAHSRELQHKRAFGATFAVSSSRLVSGAPLLAPVAVQHVDAVAIRVESLGTLRDELHVVAAEERVQVLAQSLH